MARKAAREATMKLLYQRCFSDENDQEALDGLVEELSLDDKDLPYIQDVIDGWTRHKDEIDKIIKDNSRGWKFERLSKVDISILRLALYEIIYRDDIPDSVSINEGVELAKKYSGEKSSSYINGILGTHLRINNDVISQEPIE